jgi:chromosome transmission fidelity protein 1
MDAISGIYSVEVTQTQLIKARTQLRIYLEKFRNKLKGKNRVYVAQTVRLVDSLISYMQRTVNAKANEGIVSTADLLTGKGADQINLYKLSQYLQESKLARKVDGYTVHIEEKEYKKNKDESISTPVLTQVQSFFHALTYPAAEGQFFYSCDSSLEANNVSLKYLLLDPANHFKDIVEEARAVILAGGTMSPVCFLNTSFRSNKFQMEDYKNHLFPYLPSDRLTTLSCGHVIPKENLLAIPFSTSQDGIPFDFTFENRNNPKLLTSLGQTIISLAKIIPDGLVIFFPSYAYLAQVLTHWRSQNILTTLETVKKVLFETQSSPTSTESLLQTYSSAILDPPTVSPSSTHCPNGAILLSVIGGKLSEGINFSDRLGRGVFIVGLPYPNIHTAEWKAKLAYIEAAATAKGASAAQGKSAAREFYENACLRAVNQSIGRAIRHRADFAIIGLLDRRFQSARIMSKLPGWIRDGVVSVDEDSRSGVSSSGGGFQGVLGRVARFFKEKELE